MNNNIKSLLQLHFEGPSVQNLGILWEDLSQFVTNLDIAIQRVINVLERIKIRPFDFIKSLSGMPYYRLRIDPDASVSDTTLDYITYVAFHRREMGKDY